MILVDDRIGSHDLIGHLRHWQVPCDVDRLEFGDACFTGNGANGPVAVGVEVKKIRDALQCMNDGRFAGHQLPGLVRTYDFTWLVLEGAFTVDFASGLLLLDRTRRRDAMGGRRWMYRELSNWATTMEVCAGIRLRRTSDRVETARFLADLHGWFAKPFNDHKAHLAIQTVGPNYAQFGPVPCVRMVAAQLPGIGYERSLAVCQRFKTVVEMAAATVGEWQEIEGIGPTIAKRVYDALR